MTHDRTFRQVPGRFQARLWPHRSLKSGHFHCAMAVAAIATLAAGAAFLSLGAWPVAAFLCLATALTYCAFRLNYRAGRGYEVVDLTARSLTLTRVPASGRAIRFRFNPYWVRFDISRARDGRPQLSLSSHGHRLVFGAFLSDDEKHAFAETFSRELARSRHLV